MAQAALQPDAEDVRLIEQGARGTGQEPAVNPLRIDVYAGQLRWIEFGQLQEDESKGREEKQLTLHQHMGGRVGLILDGIGQKAVERVGINTDKNADKGGQEHRHQHVGPRFLDADPGIVGEEGEIGNLDAGVMEHARGGEEQEQPNDWIAFL